MRRQSRGIALAIEQTPPEQVDRLASLTDQKLAKEKAVAAQRAAQNCLASANDELEAERVTLEGRRGEVADAIAASRREARDCDEGLLAFQQRLVSIGDDDED